MRFLELILILSTACSGLMAGLFYAYSFSVVPGLKQLSDVEYVRSMQSINKAILNPVFFTGFFGALLLFPVSTYLFYVHPEPGAFGCLLSATIVYLGGVFGVTVFGNVPLNNSLERFQALNASPESISLQRASFENSWNTLNMIRTISSTLSFLLSIIACILSN